MEPSGETHGLTVGEPLGMLVQGLEKARALEEMPAPAAAPCPAAVAVHRRGEPDGPWCRS